MALNAFNPTNYGVLTAMSGASSRVPLPGGSGVTLLVTNLGASPAWILLGDSSVDVTSSTGLLLLANASIALTVGTATHIAGMGQQGVAVMNLAQGD